jgi:hypothetical protein
MKRLFKSFYEENGYMIFLAIILVYWTIMFITNEILINETILFNSLYGQIPENYIDDIIAWQNKWRWVSYAILPVILLVKWLFVSAFISAGSVFVGLKLGFKNIYKVIMVCEWLLIFVSIANLLLLFFIDIQRIEDMERYNLVSKFSVGAIINNINTVSWLVSPLNTLNLFQLVYFLLIITGMAVLTNDVFKKHIAWVFASYGFAIFVWIVLLTYLNVTYG